VVEVHETVPALEAAFRRFNIRNAAAIRVDSVVYLSGLTAVDLDTGEVPPGGIREHARSVLDLCRLVLEDIGLSLDHVVKVNCFLAETTDFAAWNEVYLETFEAPYPCRTTVGAPLVVGRIEVEMVAALEPRR
jgi:enamine deaminase RidA (YjgF/YER057c/UK114 family)